MTTERNIIIHQGQAFELSLDYAGTAGRGQRMHIRLADSTATVVQILTHNGDANASVIFDTDALDITIGASVSAGWVVLADRVEWVYDIEDYDLADEDDCVIPYRGKVIVRGNRTRASDVTPSDQMPSGDGRYVRFDGVQGLSAGQQLQARENIGAGTGGGSSAWGAITGTLTDQTDLTTALGLKAPIASPTLTGTPAAPTAVGATSTTQIATTAFVGGEITTHAAATDPHGDRGYADTGLALKAPIASPTFTGVPAAPTAAGGTNTTQVATTAFVTSAVASAVAGLLEFIGNVDASSNPNYSAANKGDSYLISVAGKIGGASGKSVEVGDLVVASADNAGGTEASVGTSWFVLEHNLAGALLTANALSELSGVAATARSNLGLAIGTNVQAYDANLTTWAGITPGTGVGTAIGTNVGTAGSVVVNGGALGTPSSGTMTNCTFPTLNQNTTGYAEALKSATTTVSVSAATAPSSGQVLTATSGAAATWQTPAAGSPAGSSGQMQYNDASAFGAANLWRVDANTLWQYNGTTAQLFYVGNTWTDGSNYERGAVKWVSNALWLTTEKAGTGTSRQLKIGVDNVATFTILTNGVAQCAGMDLTGSYGLNAGALPIYSYRHKQFENALTSYTFVSGDYGTEYVATSASDQNYTMVASSSTHSGRWVTFYLGAAKAGSYLRFTANTGQKIRLQAGASASAGYVRSNTAGSWLTLRYNHTDAEWVATSQGGTWTIDS